MHPELPAYPRVIRGCSRLGVATAARVGVRTPHDLVIDRGDGRPVNPDPLSSAWRGLVARAGLPHIRFHDLRHAHATLMLLKGVHPKVVSERLGHASIGITLDTYSHVLPSMQTEAAAAVDELFGSTGIS